METATIKPPCTIDFTERREIIQGLRDIINTGRLFGLDDAAIDKKISKFLKKAEKAGWARTLLDTMLEQACNYTIYEQDIPHKIKEKGEYWKYAWKQTLPKYFSESAFKTKGAFAG